MAKSTRRRKTTEEDLRQQIEQGHRHPYYLLYGEGEYERDEAAAWLLAALAPEAPDFNVDTFHGEGLDVARLLDAYRSYPVMAAHRLVVLRAAGRLSSADCGSIEPLVSEPVDTSIAVFVADKVDMRRRLYKEMGARGMAVEFRVPFDNQVAAWIGRHARQRGIRIEPAAVDLLRLYVGANLRELAGEIEKLVTYAGEGEPITARQVEEQVGLSRGTSIFELTDAIGEAMGQGERSRAAELMRSLLDQGEEPLRILPMVSRHLQLLLKTQRLARARVPREDMARQLGISPFFLSGYQEQAQKVRARALWRGLSVLLEADTRLKSRSRHQQDAIMDLCLAQLARGGQG